MTDRYLTITLQPDWKGGCERERTETGGVVCPNTSMHIDMVLNAA